MSETATARTVRPGARSAPGSSRHSDESTTSRSATPIDLGELRAPQPGSPRQRQKTGRSEIEQRQHDRARDAGRRRRAAVARSPRRAPRARGPAAAKSFSSARASIFASPPGLGNEEDRPGRMPLEQAGERRARLRQPLRRAPDDVGHRARAAARASRRPPRAHAAAPAGARCRRRRPSARPSAGARSGRRGGSGRPPPSAPRCRSRSSGSSAGRAARRRGSRRRASTAPRPRPRG